MNKRSRQHGFTLIEILVAVAMIALIVSMLYTTFWTISKSTQTCRDRLALSRQAHKLLEKIARQIRCAYVPPSPRAVGATHSTSIRFKLREDAASENSAGYFKSAQNLPGGEILHMVTADAVSMGYEDGLFEFAYKFDKSSRTLSRSLQRFIDTREKALQKTNWRPLAENVKNFELAFSDGGEWSDKWDFATSRELPSAVRITITFENENHQQYTYSTVAYVSCRNNQADKTQSDRLIAADR